MNGTAQPFTVQLESTTRAFRDRHARLHREKTREARAAAKRALDMWSPLDDVNVSPYLATSTELVGEAMRDALSMAKWHEGRDNGQKFRFRKLAQCGTRVMIAQCGQCNGERKAVEEGCGIARLCERCSLRKAKKRRARFGRARARVAENLQRLGCLRRRKVEGRWISARWSDKMLTLTLPHFLRPNLDELVALARKPSGEAIGLLAYAEDTCKLRASEVDTTMARVLALRAAWPRFAAKLRKYWRNTERDVEKENKRRLRERLRDGQLLVNGRPRRSRARTLLPSVMMQWKDGKKAPPPMHRAFEWTPGTDGLGHPHLHVWMLSPFIDVNIVAAMWTEALREVGLIIEGRAIVTLQRFQDFNAAASHELIKGAPNGRGALEWSRLYKGSRRRARSLHASRSSGDGHAAPTRGGPQNAFEYADGWTIAEAMKSARPEVVASLYCALEKMRLTQAAAGFFAEDEPPHCTSCLAQQCWHVRFEPAPEPSLSFTANPNRGPPPP